MKGEFSAVMKKIQNEKLKYARQENWTAYFFDYATPCIKKKPQYKWTKGCIPLLSEKRNLGITKNYRDITLTAIAEKVYNTLFLNRISLEIEKVLRKNENGWRYD